MKTRVLALGVGMLFLTLSAVADPIVRYASDSGTGDGTSWSTPASLTDAYAAVGANEGGGEVWLMTGRYQIGNSSNWSIILTLKPDVALRGGFSGVETSADQANPLAYPTILLPGGSSMHWKTNSPNVSANTSVLVLDGMTINEPPEELAPDAKGWTVQTDYNTRRVGFGTETGTSAGTAVFSGISFVNYQGVCLKLTCEKLRVENCKFYGCGAMANTGGTGTIMVSDGDVEIDGCTFVGCSQCINANSSATERTCRVENCTFRHCIGYYGGGAIAIYVGGKMTPEVRDCTFDRCAGTLLGQTVNGLVSFSDTSAAGLTAVFSNCVVSRAYFDLSNNNSMAPLTLGRGLNGRTEIVDCLFEGITNIQTKGRGGMHSACIGTACQSDVTPQIVEVRNSRFSKNLARRTNESGYGYSSGSVFCNGYGVGVDVTFANCTIEDNRAEAPDGNAGCGYTFGAFRNIHLACVNCVLNDNDCFQAATRAVEVGYCDSSYTTSFINAILWHEADGYVPFRSATHYGLANSDIRNSPVTPSTTPTGNGYIYNLYDENPMLDAKLAERTGCVSQRRPSSKAGYNVLRGGRSVWRGTDGFYYFYDDMGRPATPWRRVDSKGTCLDDEAAAELGLSLAAEPLPDAFGVARKPNKSPLGPLNTRPRGFVIVAY